ncbi:MAG: heat shock protein Hsp20 [Verrucomicrobiaceae bacterium]|nr:heat shock protein Hsp20 [Verrucomicrobiaceae bacterium]
MTSTCNPSTSATTDRESAPAVKPRYAVTGDDQAYVVRVELPGVAKDAVSIDFDNEVLSITAARKNAVPETWKPVRRELNDLGYVLRLKLNSRVDEEKLTAQLLDGVLTLTLPIREAAKARRVEVN